MTRTICHQGGLTLVELIVVLIIVAILIGAGFLGLLDWLGTDNVNVARDRLRTDIQMTMGEGLTHPVGISTSNGNWSLQLVRQGATQELYICSGSYGGCAGNVSLTNGLPVEVRVSAIPDNVNITVNGTPLTCLAFSALGQPILVTSAATSPNACVWPTAVNGEWTFTFTAGSQASATYVY